jgi:hypothetical protein
VPPGDETSAHYISCSSETGAVSIKSASGQVMLNLCFCIWWDMRVTYCILVRPGAKHRRTIFHAHVGPVWNPQKSAPSHITPNLCFASGGFYGSHSALRCVRVTKHRASFFLVRRDRYGFHKKCTGTRYADLVFLHPV